MSIPIPDHPYNEINLNSEYNIANHLFSLMISAAANSEEIRRSWVVISNDIDIAEAQEHVRQVRHNRN